MTKFLRQLLNAREDFDIEVAHLEKATSNQGIDVKLVGDIIERSNEALHYLKLDPNDTTGKELYMAQMAWLGEADAGLMHKIGAINTTTQTELLRLIKQALKKNDLIPTTWAAKRSVIKKLLRISPPKSVMSSMGHRSIESMLKREDVLEVCAAASLLEPAEWQKSFNALFMQLNPADFESRKLQLYVFDPDFWRDAAERRNIGYQPALGVVAVIATGKDIKPGMATWALALILSYMNDSIMLSAYFKRLQAKRNFGLRVGRVLNSDAGPFIDCHGKELSWRIVHKHFCSKPESGILEPYVTADDFIWRNVEHGMGKIFTAFSFWKKLDYAGIIYDEGPVSLNLLDIAANYYGDISYNERSVDFFQTSLQEELLLRYYGQKSFEKQILESLDEN